MSLLEGSSRASWKYPCTASSLQKSFASGGIASIISRVDGNGWVGLLTNLFNVVKSVMRRTRLASALGTKAAPCGRFVDWCDDLAVDKLRDCFLDSGS